MKHLFRLLTLLLPALACAAEPRCPATDSSQPPLFCPPLNPALPNGGQPPRALAACLKAVSVRYYDAEARLRSGVVVINRDLAEDPGNGILDIFERIREFNAARIAAGKSFFPITSVKPVNEFGWSDEKSMAADNSSGYNYRVKTGSAQLSMHAYGRAIDVNTMCNPWVMAKRGGAVSIDPPGAEDPSTRSGPPPACAVTRETEPGKFVIDTFAAHGWQWGGDWSNPKDYQHFQFPSADREREVTRPPFCRP